MILIPPHTFADGKQLDEGQLQKLVTRSTGSLFNNYILEVLVQRKGGTGFLLDALTPEAWEARALCNGADPVIFEPADTDSHPGLHLNDVKAITQMRYAEAKRICGMCPVRGDCLEAAGWYDRAHTVRGGMAPTDWDQKSISEHTQGVKVLSVRGPGRPRTESHKETTRKDRDEGAAGRRRAREERMRTVELMTQRGFLVREIASVMKMGSNQAAKIRLDYLISMMKTSHPDAVIRNTVPPEVQEAASKDGHLLKSTYGGPAWTLAKSECGTMFHVAVSRGGRVQTLILRSNMFELVRTDVPLIEGSREPVSGCNR